MNGMFKSSRGLKDLAKHLYIAENIKEHVLDFIAISKTGKRNYSSSFLNVMQKLGVMLDVLSNEAPFIEKYI
jgi:uncharacterized protein with ATP-grasp and redox domains